MITVSCNSAFYFIGIPIVFAHRNTVQNVPKIVIPHESYNLVLGGVVATARKIFSPWWTTRRRRRAEVE